MEQFTLSSDYIEKMDIATFGKGAKIVAVCAPKAGEGVSSVCEMLAKRSHDMGIKSLLVVFHSSFIGRSSWQFGKNINQCFIRHKDGYLLLNVQTPEQDLLKWADLNTCSQFMNLLKTNFDRVVIDLPPVLERNLQEVSPVPIAACVDSLMLVALVGQLTSIQLKEVVHNLTVADVKIAGIVLNDRDYPTVGIELARQADKLKGIFPNFSAKISKKARESEFLNVHI